MEKSPIFMAHVMVVKVILRFEITITSYIENVML